MEYQRYRLTATSLAAVALVVGCGTSLTQLRTGPNDSVPEAMVRGEPNDPIRREMVRFCAERADRFYTVSGREELAGAVIPYLGAGVTTVGGLLTLMSTNVDDSSTRHDFTAWGAALTFVGGAIASVAAIINWTDRARNDRATAYDFASGAYHLATGEAATPDGGVPSVDICINAARQAAQNIQVHPFVLRSADAGADASAANADAAADVTDAGTIARDATGG